MMLAADRSRILAVLGPTNTGKTHLAIDRMLAHRSGMIGFPLRLLARENYDRIVKLKGRTRVALVTGEEKIVPPRADWFVCTVESMPLDRPVEFLAVDEIQLCADPERGHIFTHRLLHARGLEETMFLGAETIRPLLRRLIPDAEFIQRARFSSLTHTGYRKLTRLPPRSAIVAFSATDVYHMAELIRRQRGGTAVVLGALSPRTRNAQVGMYQAGEVDYLVATDAIGMGLNMDIDHVAFARLTKFDGQSPRRLRAPEIAQIAGRAGRHMADGTFGTTDSAGALEDEVVEAVETHTFDPLTALMWRNHDLDFRSPEQLLRSLDRRPPARELRRAPEADDHLALSVLAKDADIAGLAGSRHAVRLLWEVCQIPDFRKVLSDAHTRLLSQIYRQLRSPAGRLDPDWTARQIARLDRTEGDIDTLVTRIAHIRTWTYIAHRGDWLSDPAGWQGRTRAIEDRLSDALHDRLTQRFVDRRAAVLAKGLKGGGDLLGAVTRTGEVVVEGEFIGRLEGFRFVADESVHEADARALLSAARRALKDEIAARIQRLEAADDADFALAEDGAVSWDGQAVGALAAGPEALSPTVRPLPSDLIEPDARGRIQARLQAWIGARIASDLPALMALRRADLSGPARGIAFQLVEGLGSAPRRDVEDLVRGLGKPGRAALRALGVRIGAERVWLAPLLKPRAVAALARLAALSSGMALPPPTPGPGDQSVVMEEGVPPAFYAAIGFLPCGRRAVRIDRLEALAVAAGRLAGKGPFAAPSRLAQLVGATPADLPDILGRLGYKAAVDPDGSVSYHRRRSRAARPDRRRRQPAVDSPFAKLGALGGRS
ncbi:helicase-related protein [Inquilinus sp. CAU 1745]|uniref:helicase-related protein n=1 Tax=Inquilinus sp. CAU 1745 TaxID=3140369 RepID=UPI00325B98A6